MVVLYFKFSTIFQCKTTITFTESETDTLTLNKEYLGNDCRQLGTEITTARDKHIDSRTLCTILIFDLMLPRSSRNKGPFIIYARGWYRRDVGWVTQLRLYIAVIA